MSTAPVFIWNPVGQQETCTPVHISWQYVGPEDVVVELSITNIDVPQVNPPGTKIIGTATSGPTFTGTNNFPVESSVLSRRQNNPSQFQTPLISGIGANVREFDIGRLQVPRDGWYRLLAGGTESIFPNPSTPFYVWNGTDTSCYQPPSTPSPSNPATTSGNAPSDPTSGPVESPPPEESGGSSTNVGAIAGGVVGGVIFWALIFAAFFFMRRRSKKKEIEAAEAVGAAPPATSSKHRKPKYGGLSSLESIDASAALAATERKNRDGALAMSERRTSRSGGRRSGPYGAEEDDEKSPTSPFSAEDDYTFTPDALGYQFPGSSASSRRPSATHRNSGISNLSGGIPLDPRGAISVSPPPDVGRSGSASPPPPSDAHSAGAGAPHSKPRRKPVPSYTPSTVSGLGFAPNPNSQQDQRPPIPESISYQTTASSGSGHYAVPNNHGRAGGTGGNMQWGKDGQVHYLMPDMPTHHM